jgi:cytidylate kinase
MSVVTIRGQLGSGAPEIGRQVAERLHADYVDREIIAQVAARLQRREEEVKEKEMPPSGLLGRIAEALEYSFAFDAGAAAAYLPTWEMPLNNARYSQALEAVIKELARKGSIVIRGRGSQFILKDYPESLHILVAASPEVRLRRVMEDLKLGQEAAKREIARFDNSRHEFIKRYFHADMENPAYYDLVINTERLSYQASASIVVEAAAFKART